MTDPVFYTEPVTAVKKWAKVPNGHLLPYECAEEELDQAPRAAREEGQAGKRTRPVESRRSTS